jgi:uncharacterized protein
MSVEARVHDINRHLVKSCARNDIVGSIRVDQGIDLDRHWMIIDENGSFVTQRENPKLALIQPMEYRGSLILLARGEQMAARVVIGADGPRRDVTVWGKQYIGVDDGDAAARWINRFLGSENYRLVHMAPECVRERSEGYGRMGFVDSWPLTIVSTESVKDLNRRIIENGGEPIGVERFRPNIVVSGCEAYAEDRWAKIRINGVEIDVSGPRIRCVVTTIDQSTGDSAGKEPLKTLAKYRRTQEGEVVFAQKAANVNSGTIFINADVEVLEEKDPPEFRQAA